MRSVLFAVSLVFGVCAAASAETITLVVYSDPVGATISVQVPAGITGSLRPVWLKYDMQRGFTKKHQCRMLKPITARWASGADKTIEPTICGADGKTQAIVLRRPPDAPNREIDMQFALKVLELEVQQQGNTTQSDRPEGVTCNSFPIGRSVITRCY